MAKVISMFPVKTPEKGHFDVSIAIVDDNGDLVTATPRLKFDAAPGVGYRSGKPAGGPNESHVLNLSFVQNVREGGIKGISRAIGYLDGNRCTDLEIPTETIPTLTRIYYPPMAVTFFTELNAEQADAALAKWLLCFHGSIGNEKTHTVIWGPSGRNSYQQAEADSLTPPQAMNLGFDTEASGGVPTYPASPTGDRDGWAKGQEKILLLAISERSDAEKVSAFVFADPKIASAMLPLAELVAAALDRE
ncbi:MAG: hypothetical protein V3R83_09780 [Gammaproteobacteria bacterium]